LESSGGPLGMIKLKDILLEKCWKGYEKKGMKTMFGKKEPNCVKKEAKLPDEGFSTKKQMDVRVEDVDENLKRWFDEKWTDQHGRSCGNKKTKGVKKCRPSKKVSGKTPKTWKQVDKKKEVAKKRRVGMGKRTTKAEEIVLDETNIEEKKDACYHKVKARYTKDDGTWPSAYGSGALVQCRKKGAANWGTSGKKK
jgi:hypothetical protein